MYILDEQNRKSILTAVEKRINEFPKPALPTPVDEASVVEKDTKQISNTILFLEVLRPMNGSAKEALQFMTQKIEEAGFEYKLFSRIPRLENGKNPYGLNGCMAAMIDFFYELNYFKKEYSLEEIFKAYLQFSGNTIGKFKTFISEFRYDNSFIKHSDKLKKLKINKLL